MSAVRRLLGFGIAQLGLVAFIAGMFWYQDWQYSLPTPQPVDLYQPSLGTRLAMPATIEAALVDKNRPALLHFVNPDCPCSRFSLDHIRALHQQFSGQVNFVVVLEGTDAGGLQQQLGDLHLPANAVIDADRAIAHLAGIYATPQAVILDQDLHLIYRGNYNISRYCTSRQTEFVRIALEKLLSNTSPKFVPPVAATTAYGCPLPTCPQIEGPL